ncbi:TlyA family RNA methyltransferase [Calditerricola satsumensis]|uniref:Putative rRNA methyltransferase YqxC n=1 Tax=Calditerricola satsumensis TaxID=373054 RepID=A0A8J3B7J1_9BACI|nr:TlyA family RNA methyltransferase [Calditerricola satsumensis]GGK01369.1 putative rRNA methyltransferase YqxC [Calditerricola satsumensis]
MAKKERLDVLLVTRGLFPTREKARRAIMAGLVRVDGATVDKAGEKVPPDARIEVKGDPCPYVSRGGLKLERALRVFGLDLTGKTVLDVGASTGGFTDCALQHGARRVYAVDVGYGQLDWKLRQDPRVVVMERTNFRYAEPSWFPEPPDVATVDVSFISLGLIFPPLAAVLKAGGDVVALVKPQFEAGPERVGKHGVVRDPRVHADVLRAVIQKARAANLVPLNLTPSPIRGGEGNIEFLLHARKGDAPGDDVERRIDAVVREAHDRFRAEHATDA